MLKSVSLLISILFIGLLPLACTPSNESHPNPPKIVSKGPQSADNSWQDGFPSHWWKPVPREQAKPWEILPQDAGFKEVILSKRNELGILSNFAETPFVFHGVCYPTVEAFWQMMKYPEDENDPRWNWAHPWRYSRAQVSQFNGYAAKAAGNYANDLMDKNDANWATFEGKVFPFVSKEPAEHYQLIWNALIEKLRQNPKVLEILLSTKDLTLRPDHGISDKAPREWHYNLLYMDLRSLVQNNELSLQTQEDISLRTCKGHDNK